MSRYSVNISTLDSFLEANGLSRERASQFEIPVKITSWRDVGAFRKWLKGLDRGRTNPDQVHQFLAVLNKTLVGVGGLQPEEIGFIRPLSINDKNRQAEIQGLLRRVLDSVDRDVTKHLVDLRLGLKTIVRRAHSHIIKSEKDVEKFQNDFWLIAHDVMGEKFFSEHPGGCHFVDPLAQVLSQVKLSKDQQTGLVDNRKNSQQQRELSAREYMQKLTRGVPFGLSGLIAEAYDRPSNGIVVAYYAVPKHIKDIHLFDVRYNVDPSQIIGMVNCVIDVESLDLQSILANAERLCASNETDKNEKIFGEVRVTLADKHGVVICDSDASKITSEMHVSARHPWLDQINIEHIPEDISRSSAFAINGINLLGPQVLTPQPIDDTGYYAPAVYHPDLYFLAVSMETRL